jgi:excisionase family DNA binding protein
MQESEHPDANRTEIDWLRTGEAARLLGVSGDIVRRLARRGLLTTLELPGSNTRISRADVEKLARESVRRPSVPRPVDAA